MRYINMIFALATQQNCWYAQDEELIKEFYSKIFNEPFPTNSPNDRTPLVVTSASDMLRVKDVMNRMNLKLNVMQVVVHPSQINHRMLQIFTK